MKRIRKERRGCCICRFLGRALGLLWKIFKLLAKALGKLAAILAPVYAILFAVFYFDLDGKLLYYVVEPFLCKHYDRMERKNPLEQPYDMV